MWQFRMESGQCWRYFYIPSTKSLYIVKSNEKRDEKQEEREKNYQSVIEKLTEKLEILHQVQSDLSEIKENLFDKHKQ